MYYKHRPALSHVNGTEMPPAGKRALKDATKWNLISRNPAIGANKPKTTRPEISTWTAEESRLFLSLTEAKPLYPLWRVMAATGMRRGEALGLRWSDVDLENRRLSVRHSRTQAGIKR